MERDGRRRAVGGLGLDPMEVELCSHRRISSLLLLLFLVLEQMVGIVFRGWITIYLSISCRILSSTTFDFIIRWDVLVAYITSILSLDSQLLVLQDV